VQRHRIGFRQTFKVAFYTSSIWLWGAVPIWPSPWWWIKGVPEKNLRMMDQPTRRERIRSVRSN
jgi:hypothetical protein